jgi:hypothetical protein
MNRRTTAFVVALLSVGSASYAQPNKEQYKLQERCDKLAKQKFIQDWGANGFVNVANGRTWAKYENHYNARLKKCFYLEVRSLELRQRQSNKINMLRLFDLNENKEYASFNKGATCEVRGKKCHSQLEWVELIKPYMEE